MRSLSIVCLMLGLLCRSTAQPVYTGNPGRWPVGTFEATWHDARRNRDVPVKIYFPSGPDAPARSPVILFSHGLGGSREGYGYLGEHWASWGYVSVHVQHHGSDDDALRTGGRPLRNFKKAASDPDAATNRRLDISFAIDRLTELNSDPAFSLHGRLDLQKIGAAGHSYGAFTTMAIAGARIPVFGPEPKYRDSRVKAAVAMSTPTTSGNDTDAAFDGVKIPVFHLTGTKDELPGWRRKGGTEAIVGDTKAAERLRPYQHTRHAPAYLLVFAGGDHMVFSGRLTATRATDQEFQARVLSSSTAFWDAWLKDDAGAKAWLENGGFSAVLGKFGTFEHKTP